MKEIRHKIRDINRTSKDNENRIDLLKRKQLITNRVIYSKKQRKIILAENILLNGEDMQWPHTVEKVFEKFPERNLKFGTLVPIFYGEDGFPIDPYNEVSENNQIFICLFQKHWKKVGDNMVLRVSIRASLKEKVYAGAGWTGYDRPLYLTLYMLFLNSRVFDEERNTKT